MGPMGHCKSKGLYFLYGKEMKIISWEQDCLYSTELLRG